MSSSLSAGDIDHDFVDVGIQSREPIDRARTQTRGHLRIGIIVTGDFLDPMDRLIGLGYTVTPLSPDSDLNALRDYDVVYLPANWASAVEGDYDRIESHAKDYHNYVRGGGGLFVEQPNPYLQPDNVVTPSLLPFGVTFNAFYRLGDWPPVIVDLGHQLTAGLEGRNLPGPADQMKDVSPYYQVLVTGKESGSPSLVVLEHGRGKVLVHGAHSSYGSIRPFSDEAYVRMINWTGDPALAGPAE